MSSVGNIDFDDILKKLAKDLHKNEDIDNLGKALGFGTGDIRRKIEENGKQGGSSMGTLDLLRTWQNSQTPSTEEAALKEALLKAGLKKQADKFLSTPVTVDNPTSVPLSGVAHVTRMDRIVKDRELRKLAGCLPADSFMDVAIYLELEYTDYDNIKLQNPASLKDANFKMLMKWKTDKGGYMGELDEALTEAKCGALKYKDV